MSPALLDEIAVRRAARLSVKDFHRATEIGLFDARAELIRGVVFERDSETHDIARISVDDFHRGVAIGIYGKRAELIRGVVFERMPASPLHRNTSKVLYDLLKEAVPPGHVVFFESPLTLHDSEPIPDLLVAPGQVSDYWNVHPSSAALVVEVAVSSESLDRANAVLYAEAEVPEYWIVLAQRRQVEVYLRPREGEYRERRIYAGDEEVACAAFPAVRVALPELFA